jgi:predicted nucleic acid-binding protein
MIVVADTSPLIFLARLRRLELIRELFPGELLVPTAVREEILAPPQPPDEEHLLRAFLQDCLVVRVTNPRAFATGMSDADNAALTLAVRKHADLLLADDGLVRRMAKIENVRPMGTLGVLLAAMKQGLLAPPATRQTVQALVRSHGFRISIDVFEAVLSEVARFEGRDGVRG